MNQFQCAVVGNPIAHSLSPTIHHAFAKQTGVSVNYEKILAADANFEEIVQTFFAKGGRGLNITAPFKERAFSLASKYTTDASLAGAANTLWFDGGELHAANTDGVGLANDLSRFLTLKNKQLLILGAGGAVRGILPALEREAPASITVANRTLSKAADLQTICSDLKVCEWQALTGSFDCVINGMSNTALLEDPSFNTAIFEHADCYDLRYYADDFVFKAKQCGADKAIKGIGMLVAQAAYSFEIWFAKRPLIEPVINQLGR